MEGPAGRDGGAGAGTPDLSGTVQGSPHALSAPHLWLPGPARGEGASLLAWAWYFNIQPPRGAPHRPAPAAAPSRVSAEAQRPRGRAEGQAPAPQHQHRTRPELLPRPGSPGTDRVRTASRTHLHGQRQSPAALTLLYQILKTKCLMIISIPQKKGREYPLREKYRGEGN